MYNYCELYFFSVSNHFPFAPGNVYGSLCVSIPESNSACPFHSPAFEDTEKKRMNNKKRATNIHILAGKVQRGSIEKNEAQKLTEKEKIEKKRFIYRSHACSVHVCFFFFDLAYVRPDVDTDMDTFKDRRTL